MVAHDLGGHSAANRYLDLNPLHAIKGKPGWTIEFKQPTV